MANQTDGRRDPNWNLKRKIPRTHKKVAQILKAVEEKKGLNNLLYNTKNPQRESGIVHHVLKNQRVLDYLITNTPLSNEPKVDVHLLKVVLDLGFLQDKIHLKNPGQHLAERLVIKYQAELQKCLANFLKENQLADVKELDTQASFSNISSYIPRYVRINTIKSSKEKVLSRLRKDGFKFVRYDSKDYSEFTKLIRSLEIDQFVCDVQFDELLVFHPKCSFFNYSLYQDGTLILQDKASLLPSTLLRAKAGKLILDCCAAPGLKTSHIAALLNNNCSILASDKSEDRLNTMRSLIELHGATCVNLQVNDFSKIDPHSEPYNQVRYILLDPSCSGSGMVKSRNLAGDDPSEISIDRLANLAHFQTILLNHALSFPKVKRVSYSTCSIHPMENEDVVLRAFEKFRSKFKLVRQDENSPYGFLADNDDDKYSSLSGRILKTNSERDLTNGFFLAVFQRKKQKPEIAE